MITSRMHGSEIPWPHPVNMVNTKHLYNICTTSAQRLRQIYKLQICTNSDSTNRFIVRHFQIETEAIFTEISRDEKKYTLSNKNPGDAGPASRETNHGLCINSQISRCVYHSAIHCCRALCKRAYITCINLAYIFETRHNFIPCTKEYRRYIPCLSLPIRLVHDLLRNELDVSVFVNTFITPAIL